MSKMKAKGHEEQLLFVSICVHVYPCTCGCSHTCVQVWRPKDHLRCQLIRYHPLSFKETDSLTWKQVWVSDELLSLPASPSSSVLAL